MAHSEGRKENNWIVINLPFHITRPGKWCRVSADFEFIAKAKHGFVIHYEQSQHKFELSLCNQAGRTLIKEVQPFRAFLGFSWSRRKQSLSIASARSSSHHHAEGLPLLEFVPPHLGQFSIAFKIPVKETMNDGRFQYESRFERFALSVKENVLRMKAHAYPHKKIDLRQMVGDGPREK